MLGALPDIVRVRDMKRVCVVFLLVGLIAGSGRAVTVGTWCGSVAADPCHPVAGTGSWEDPYWNDPPTSLPPSPGTSGDEVKIIRDATICTVATNVGNYNWTLSVGSVMTGGAAAELEIVGGSIGMREIRIGAGGTTGSSTITGYLDQKGGTVSVYNDGDIIIGRMGKDAGRKGAGYYTISGGTIKYDGLTTTKGRLYVGGVSSTGGVNGAEGTFTVVGNAPSITMRKLYVAAQTTTRYGTGTLKFEIGSAGVSPIRLTAADSVILDQAGGDSTAKLLVSLTAAPLPGNITLVENQSTGNVIGTFDTVNGNPAPEGASVVLSFGGNNYNYTLTYKGIAGIDNIANDIVLTLQPATPALPRSD